jgi:hypothetical protein
MPFITEVSDEEEHMSTDRGTPRPYVTMRVVRAATTSTSALLTARTTRGTAARRQPEPGAATFSRAGFFRAVEALEVAREMLHDC